MFNITIDLFLNTTTMSFKIHITALHVKKCAFSVVMNLKVYLTYKTVSSKMKVKLAS